MADKDEPKEYGRRNFFREGLREMLSPLADLLADRIKDMPDFSALSQGQGVEEIEFIRPPGALAEARFLETCIRCGCCKNACPYGVITLMRREDIAQAGRSNPYSWRPYRETGTPRIQPGAEPCRMCEGFPCAAACPTGALVKPAFRAVIGCAVLNDDTCLRTAGEDCRICVNACPVGEDALRIRRKGQVQVRAEGCTGCGFCENVCPVDPSAIKVYLPGPGERFNQD